MALAVAVLARATGAWALGTGARWAGAILAIGGGFHLDRVEWELESSTATGLRKSLMVRSLVTLAAVCSAWFCVLAVVEPNSLGLGIGVETAAYVMAAWAGAVWGGRAEPRVSGIVAFVCVLFVAGIAVAADRRYEMFPISTYQDGYAESRVRWLVLCAAASIAWSAGVVRSAHR